MEGKSWRPPLFRAAWLVILGFLPQYLAFYLPLTRQLYPDWLASASLVLSQSFLLVFTFVNRHLPGMALLLIGLGCNLAVIVANGGFMPLPLETAQRLVPPTVLSQLEIGARLGSSSKDILLPEAQIILPWLADRFASPAFLPYRFAFSLGDVLVAAGAFLVLARNQSAVPKPTLGELNVY
ncbi:MAG: DUF5317 domain-containing protein [Chloroflexota bacterium]